jgi:hypothetical protein
MKSTKIPHDDYREGWIIGYQLPAPPAGTTRFLMGIKDGFRTAGGQFIGPNGQLIT